MTIQPISTAALVLYISPADLEERGLCCADITQEHTLALTQEALQQAGILSSELLEIESWPDKCGLLVFVHFNQLQQTVWFFSDTEDLLSAAASLHTLPPNNLYWWANHFWLTIEGDVPALSEFCNRIDQSFCLLERVQEYGTVLLTHNALTQLNNLL